jgi:glutamate synthase (NADPH/NADH) large chain
MAEKGSEPIGSMGSDTPLAVLSPNAPNLFSYFHQLFAQVTNPPIDPIRESLVMSVEANLGPEGNTFDETPEHCHRLKIPGPVLTSADVERIASIHEGAFEPIVLPLLYPASAGPEGLESAVDALSDHAAEAVDEGYNILILSDRGVDEKNCAIPSLLALSAVHQHLVRLGTRMQCGLVIETAEAREVHDFAVLLGYGAAAVCPYAAFDTLRHLYETGDLTTSSLDEANHNFASAIAAGIKKIMAKMGISTSSGAK